MNGKLDAKANGTTHLLKALIKALLPHRYHYHLRRKQLATDDLTHRFDKTLINVGHDVYLNVFWKDYGVGYGPALAVCVQHEEVMKFDLYGDQGHFHAQVTEPEDPATTALKFAEQSVDAQIERTVFELCHNLAWYLGRHPRRKVRRAGIDASKLQASLPRVRQLLKDYSQRANAYKAQNPSQPNASESTSRAA